MTGPEWAHAPDPWLSDRMRARGRIGAAEQRVIPAVAQGMDEFLTAARAAVLDTGGTPNLSAWPDGGVWTAIVDRVILPVLGRVFGDSFAAAVRGLTLNVTHYRVAYLATTRNRLSPRLWPRAAFEEMRTELDAGVAAGEDLPTLRERVAGVLDINALSRELRAEAADLRARRDNPTTPEDERRDVRRQLREVYARTDADASAWQWQADRIARTETMAALNAGTHAAGLAWHAATGLPLYQRWLATDDLRTRDTHQDADGQTVTITQKFRVGGAFLSFPGDPEGPPQETIQCVPAGTMVRHGHLNAAMRRWYDGYVIDISLASGNKLTITPNHPVLRADGRWLPAGELDEGNDLVRCMPGWDLVAAPNEQRPPADIAQVFRSAEMTRKTIRVSLTPPDLHGDGGHGNVDVVAVDGVLGVDDHPAFNEQLRQLGFALARWAGSGVCRCDGRAVTCVGTGGPGPWPTSGGVGVGCECSGVFPGHTQPVGVAAPSGRDICLEQCGSYSSSAQPDCRRDDLNGDLSGVHADNRLPLPEGRPAVSLLVAADVDTGRNQPLTCCGGADSCLCRESCQCDRFRHVTIDKIVKVTRRLFSGHVYNLDTRDGWYIANDTPIQNCRCTALHVEEP